MRHRGTVLLSTFVQGKEVCGPEGLWGQGDALYSYGAVIAVRERGTDGKVKLVRLPVLATEDQTLTTRRHRGMVRRACHLYAVECRKEE